MDHAPPGRRLASDPDDDPFVVLAAVAALGAGRRTVHREHGR